MLGLVVYCTFVCRPPWSCRKSVRFQDLPRSVDLNGSDISVCTQSSFCACGLKLGLNIAPPPPMPRESQTVGAAKSTRPSSPSTTKVQGDRSIAREGTSEAE